MLGGLEHPFGVNPGIFEPHRLGLLGDEQLLNPCLSLVQLCQEALHLAVHRGESIQVLDVVGSCVLNECLAGYQSWVLSTDIIVVTSPVPALT